MIKFDQFATRIKLILGNPQSNPKAALLLLGMVGVLALIIILISFILYSLTREAQKEHTEKSFSLKKSIIMLGITGLVFVSLSYAGSIYISRSSLCSQCHIMRSSVTSWKNSEHKNISCNECHQKKQFFGQLEFSVKRFGELVNYNQNNKKKQKVTASVTENNCIACHENTIKETNVFKSIRVAHSHFAGVFKCSDCHKSGHERKNNPYQIEELCLSCHRSKKKSNKCSFCHARDIGVHVVTPNRDFKKVQYGGLTTCRGCHSISICTKCHGIEIPHPQNWKRPEQHAKYAVFKKKNKICKKCHDIPAFCQKCHRFPGHDSKWYIDHQNADKKWCLSCHRTTDMCALCHTQSNEKVTGLLSTKQ